MLKKIGKHVGAFVFCFILFFIYVIAITEAGIPHGGGYLILIPAFLLPLVYRKIVGARSIARILEEKLALKPENKE